MFGRIDLRKYCYKKFTVAAPVALGFSLAFVFAPATAESPSDPKKVVFEVIERNAEQIATVGDVVYYFGEPGMQEYETSKYLKATLEQIGFKVAGRCGFADQCLGDLGFGKTSDRYRHGNGFASGRVANSG